MEGNIEVDLSSTPTSSIILPINPSVECIPQNISMVKTESDKILDLFELCKEDLIRSLPPSFSDLDEHDLYMLFLNIVSYNLAPYGGSSAIELSELISATQLDCDNYAIAVGIFWNLRNQKTDITMHFVGWHGGAVGNHAQIFTSNNKSGVNLLLDPTIALVALTTFDDLASGKIIDSGKILDFSHRNDLINFKTRIIESLILGKYKPSDLLYFYENLDHYLGKTTYEDIFITPGGVKWRHDKHPEYYTDN